MTISPVAEAEAIVGRIVRLRRLATLFDSAIAIPGTGIRFGLDPVLGLIPGLGDVAGAIVSGMIILEGARLGVDRTTLVRMLTNVLVDTAGGSLPILGDIFDVAWKSNNRNLELVESHLHNPVPVRRSSGMLVVGVLAGVAVAVIASGALAIWLGSLLLRAVR